MNNNRKAFMVLLANRECRVKFRKFVEITENWFSAMGATPDLVAPKAPGFSGKTVAYNRVRGKLQDETMEEAKHITFLKMQPGSEAVLDALINVSISSSDRYGKLFLSSDISYLGITEAQWLSLAEKLYQAIPFTYGYCHELPREVGPGYYAGGVSYRGPRADGSEVHHEEELRTRWFHTLLEPIKHPMDKTLRQVYHLQFLSEGHLDLPIQNVTLRQWIEQSPDHGQLRPFLPGLWTWSVPSDDQIEAANLALFEANLLAAWDPKLAERV